MLPLHEELGRLILIADQPVQARAVRECRSTTNCVNHGYSTVAVPSRISRLPPPAPGRL